MAQVKLLKIDADGIPTEFDTAADDITLNSFTIQGTNGSVLSTTGLNLNTNPISASGNISFSDPTTNTINQTAGSLVINNIVAKDRSNLFSATGELLFPTVTNTAGQLDNFRLPTVAGAPTATPTNAGAGYVVFDSTNGDTYVWTGTLWDNLNTVATAQSIDDGFIAAATIAARDVVYISAADNVSPAVNTSAVTSAALGFATAGAAAAASVNVRKFGRLPGFTGLTPGVRYFLSGTAGAISATTPTASGATICMVGYAKNATTLEIAIQNLGRRA